MTTEIFPGTCFYLNNGNVQNIQGEFRNIGVDNLLASMPYAK